MIIDINERDVIYILNCINTTLFYLKYHNRKIKEEMSYYYNFDNYNEDYSNLNLLHRRISVMANIEYYKVYDYNLFIGQRDYINSKEKDFKILKNNKNKNFKTNRSVYIEKRK